MKTLEQLFDKNKILPTLVLEDITKTVDVVNVLYEAGIRMMSVRVLSQTSLRSIELIRKKMPEMAVGAAGTMDAAGFLNEEDYVHLRKAHTFFRWMIDSLRVVRGNAKDITVPPYGSDEFAFLTRRLLYGSDTIRLQTDLGRYAEDVQQINSRLLV